MTVSIRKLLAALPSGEYGADLSWAEVGAYLNANYDTLEEKDRNRRHALRDDIYHDGGVAFMEEAIDDVFLDEETRKKRKKWVKWARYSNPLKRVVNELSSVYAEAATRTVDGEANDKKYKDVLDKLGMDAAMLHVSRLLNLHRAVLIRPRVRELLGQDPDREPVMDWATPAVVRAIVHPNDSSLVIGWAIQSSFKTARRLINEPSWVLWTDHEMVQLRSDMKVIEESVVEHGLGRNPWVAVTLTPPGPGFWPGEEGEDLVGAAVSMWMQAIFALKESKSATKQTIIQGDGTTLARGQIADSEVPTEIADGQSITTVDMSMDLSMFRDNADHILEHVAQNYGMSAALVNNQGVQSAEAREAMRMPLRELRKQQQVPLRKLEGMFVESLAAVLKKDMSEVAFDPDGWRIEFGEAETALSRIAETDLFIKERTAGIDNTRAFIQRRRSCSPEQADQLMKENIIVETERNALMRPLQQISGSMGADQPDGSQPMPDAQPVDQVPVDVAAEQSAQPAAPATEAPSSDLQKEALNGAQVTSLLQVVTAVAARQIPAGPAQAILELAFQLTPEEAKRMLPDPSFSPPISNSSDSVETVQDSTVKAPPAVNGRGPRQPQES